MANLALIAVAPKAVVPQVGQLVALQPPRAELIPGRLYGLLAGDHG